MLVGKIGERSLMSYETIKSNYQHFTNQTSESYRPNFRLL